MQAGCRCLKGIIDGVDAAGTMGVRIEGNNDALCSIQASDEHKVMAFRAALVLRECEG